MKIFFSSIYVLWVNITVITSSVIEHPPEKLHHPPTDIVCSDFAMSMKPSKSNTTYTQHVQKENYQKNKVSIFKQMSM